MIILYHSRKDNGTMCAVPMVDEKNCDRFKDANCATWVYCHDGKKHGKLPSAILPDLIDLYGSEESIRQRGYRKHWLVFQDLSTEKYYFGNYPQFSKSIDRESRERAEKMMSVDIDLLITL